jgi:hypothetical protein
MASRWLSLLHFELVASHAVVFLVFTSLPEHRGVDRPTVMILWGVESTPHQESGERGNFLRLISSA